MRTTINIEKARELGFPIPENATAMILYEVEPAGEVANAAAPVLRWPVLCWHCKQDIAEEEATNHTIQCLAHPLRKELNSLRAQLDSEQALRKGLEQELEDTLAKLTEPPAKPKPVEPTEAPIDRPKKKVNG